MEPEQIKKIEAKIKTIMERSKEMQEAMEARHGKTYGSAALANAQVIAFGKLLCKTEDIQLMMAYEMVVLGSLGTTAELLREGAMKDKEFSVIIKQLTIDATMLAEAATTEL